VAELAAIAYELVLQLLNRFFTPTDETEPQLSTLIGAAIGMMGGVLRPLATTLTTLPVGPPHAGRTAGFTFEVYYVLGNMVPGGNRHGPCCTNDWRRWCNGAPTSPTSTVPLRPCPRPRSARQPSRHHRRPRPRRPPPTPSTGSP
jgi:hypothetical protein